MADLALAFALAGLTFALAYPAAHALGAVLLQTAPARGAAGAHAEAFLRAMRDVERHPQVLHLPAPHVWTLAPQRLVATLELHVPQATDDEGVRALSRWARERVLGALAAGRREDVTVEVTVGVVRG
jgi:Co/Zn/Cd efflux system component